MEWQAEKFTWIHQMLNPDWIYLTSKLQHTDNENKNQILKFPMFRIDNIQTRFTTKLLEKSCKYSRILILNIFQFSLNIYLKS